MFRSRHSGVHTLTLSFRISADIDEEFCFGGFRTPMRQTLFTFTSAGFDVKAAFALVRERCSRATAFSTTEGW